MRSQLFHQSRPGQFVERFSPRPESSGQTLRRGRGFARLDANLDGLMDFAVSSIDARASLVINRTSKLGHFLNVRLVARNSARDAIGLASQSELLKDLDTRSAGGRWLHGLQRTPRTIRARHADGTQRGPDRMALGDDLPDCSSACRSDYIVVEGPLRPGPVDRELRHSLPSV